MEGRPPLNHKDSGNHTFDRLILDPNSNFEELIPVDEDFLKDYVSELSGMQVDQAPGTAASQPQQQQQQPQPPPPGRGLHHQTSLQRHQAMLIMQQQQQQQQQHQQMDALNRLSSDGSALQHDGYSGQFNGLVPIGSRQNSNGSVAGAAGGPLGYSGGSGSFGAEGRPPLPPGFSNAPLSTPLGSGEMGLRNDSAPADYAQQQQLAISSLLASYQQQQQQPPAAQYGLEGFNGGDSMTGGLRTVSAGSAFGAHNGLPPGPPFAQDGNEWERMRAASNPDVPSSFAMASSGLDALQGGPAPNLVLSSQEVQPEFGGGAPGGPSRVANHRVVVANNSTPPDPTQYGLNAIGSSDGGTPPGQFGMPAARPGSMQPPPARRVGGYGAPGTASTTFDRLAGDSGALPNTSPAMPSQSANSDDLDALQDAEGDEMDMGEDGQGATRNRRHRTLRQQMLNKQAQQRYRERKKAKANELEHTVAALTSQLESMQTVKEENANLQDKNLNLVSQLRAREEELERLLREQAAQPAYMKTNSGRVLEMPKQEEGPTTAQELEQLSQTYQTSVRELREILAKHNLENKEGVDIMAATVPEATIVRLTELVETVNNIHSRAIRMEGANTAGLVSASVDRSSGRHDTNRRWAEAAKLLRFTPEQSEKMLSVRREHLRRLQRIYEDRRQVNLEAISVLLPQERGGSAPSMSVERAKSWLPSMFHRSKHASRQKDVMKKLKDNLSEEQRLASELDYLVFRRILTPAQGAWFILHKYPAYCDSLSLCNGVAELEGAMDQDI